MKKTLGIGLLSMLLLSSTTIAHAGYIQPEQINGENTYEINEVMSKLNGVKTTVSDDLFGKGVSFYINDKMLTSYKDSILYKTSDGFIPISTEQISIDGKTLTIPSNKKVTNSDSISLSEDIVSSVFGLEIKNKGIYFDSNKVEPKYEKPKPDGVEFDYLESHLGDLGFSNAGNHTYQYFENNILQQNIEISEKEVVITWYHNQGDETRRLQYVLEALFPYSYSKIYTQLGTESSGVFDKRTVSIEKVNDYTLITVKNKE